MDIVIIYFSGTGNTELIAKELSQRFLKDAHKVELISLEDETKINNLDFRNKIIGFGFPVYKFSYPDIFLDKLELFNEKGNNNKYFLFSTYARFAADSFLGFSKNLDNSKFRLIAQESFKSPSCGISARKDENDYEYKSVMFFEDDIHKKLDWYVNKITSLNLSDSYRITNPFHPLNRLKLKIIEDIEHTKYPKLQIDIKSCQNCGLCAKKCPDSNFMIKDYYVQILDDINCLHCLRCMNHCPTNSISFGRLSIGENRYTLNKRNELFLKATSGYKEKYWNNFDKVCSKWRINTIIYWLKHKYHPEIYDLKL